MDSAWVARESIGKVSEAFGVLHVMGCPEVPLPLAGCQWLPWNGVVV